jgi:hypothetical protein
MTGTREDALLVVELAKYAAMLGIADATGKFFGDESDPERAERANLLFASCSASTVSTLRSSLSPSRHRAGSA